jgi:hypothetical protein
VVARAPRKRRENRGATSGTRLALASGMRNRVLVDLLTELHRSIDRVAEDLAPDRPELARALRKQSARIPRPEEIARGQKPSSARPSGTLAPLLYHALDEGALDARSFDVLMVQRLRAARLLGAGQSR